MGRTSARLPAATRVVIVGAGFAGAATARSLGELGLGPGVILEREPIPGAHSSGRNAALAPQVEDDPVITALATAGVRRLREMTGGPEPVLRETGALYLGDDRDTAFFEEQVRLLAALGVPARLLTQDEARARFPFLGGLRFQAALLSPTDGVIRRAWACLRTFAPDRRPVIGWDPVVRGLLHVSGLGGFGASTSPAVGEIAAALAAARDEPYVDLAGMTPARLADAAAVG